MTPQTHGEKLVQLEQRVKTIEYWQDRIEMRLGKTEEVMSTFTSFVNTHEAIEKERDRVQDVRHQENSDKLDEISSKTAKRSLWVSFASMVWALAGVMVAILAIWVMVKLSNRSLNVPLFKSSTPTLAIQAPQTAHTLSMR